MTVWKKSKKHGIHLADVAWGRCAIVRARARRYEVHINVRGDEEGGYRGKYLTWRPTLREAKERAEWAYLDDLGRSDDAYGPEGLVRHVERTEEGEECEYDHYDEEEYGYDHYEAMD